MPEVSVVIVSYRCRDLLIDCLRSLDAQRGDIDLEVLLLDNHSQDGTLEAASKFPWVDAQDLGENIGFAKANNRGFAMATGETILALNPDTVVPPGALRACLDTLHAHPDIGVLSPKLVDREGRLDRRCKRGFPTVWSSFCYFTGLDRYLRDRRSTRYTAGWLGEDEVGDVESVMGAFMLMPRAALLEVGGFDEQFFMYAEDIDLCLRFRAAGWRVHYWPRVSVIHVGAGSNAQGFRPPAANAAYFRTMAPFIRKHSPGLRGRLTAAAVAVIAEMLYLASRVHAYATRRIARA